MHENFPAGGILVNGLGYDACKGLVITTNFNLWCGIQVIVTTQPTGGSRPLSPGEIQNFFKPVQPEYQPSYVKPYDYDPLAKPKNHVVIRVTFKDRVVEKEYVVSQKRIGVVIKLVNLVNTTKSRVSAVAQNIRRIASKAIITVKNLRKK